MREFCLSLLLVKSWEVALANTSDELAPFPEAKQKHPFMKAGVCRGDTSVNEIVRGPEFYT